jgi:hypothetical protein
MAHPRRLMIHTLRVIGLLTCFVCPGFAAAASIVKAGLWEVTVTTRVSETRTEIPELGKELTEEHAKVAAEMRRPVVAPELTRTARECVAPRATSRWSTFTKLPSEQAGCSWKPVIQNVKTFKAALVCSTARRTGTAAFTATSERFNGEITVVMHESSYDRTDTKVVSGKLVAKSCEGHGGAE